MAEVVLAAEVGRPTGSRAVRRLRREGKIPAVIYGHGTDPLPVAIVARELRIALNSEAGANQLLSLDTGSGTYPGPRPRDAAPPRRADGDARGLHHRPPRRGHRRRRADRSPPPGAPVSDRWPCPSPPAGPGSRCRPPSPCPLPSPGPSPRERALAAAAEAFVPPATSPAERGAARHPVGLVDETPPHVDGVAREQRPLEDVGPTELVAAPGAAQLPGAHCERKAGTTTSSTACHRESARCESQTRRSISRSGPNPRRSGDRRRRRGSCQGSRPTRVAGRPGRCDPHPRRRRLRRSAVGAAARRRPRHRPPTTPVRARGATAPWMEEMASHSTP